MKKKLLCAILCGISACGFADVVLYGKAAVGLEHDSFSTGGIPGAGSIQDFGSFFGIRGYDAIYDDTSAIFQIEQLLDIAAGQAYYMQTATGLIVQAPGSPAGGRVTSEVNSLATGQTYIGLQGNSWGRIRLGNTSNYMRSNMSSVDMYNYGQGVNGLGTYSRTNKLIPVSIRYDSPTWYGFDFAALYSFNNSGQFGISGVGGSNNFGGGLDGYYSGGVYSVGAEWVSGAFSVKLGTQLWNSIGKYVYNGNSNYIPVGYTPASTYNIAYATRIEFGYDDIDSAIIGVGIQSAQGLGWWGWANSGGSFSNYLLAPGIIADPNLSNAKYQTQEIALTFGWHFGPWTPKISYAHGANMMVNGSFAKVLIGNATKINDTGYNQLALELDWNITPRTIAFVNYGQVWWGRTLQNINYCGTSCTTYNANNPAFANQSSVSVGFSHTF